MALTKVVKQNDEANAMELQFEYATNVEELDPPIGTPAQLVIQKIDGGDIIVDSPLTITDVTAGVITVVYQWGDGELSIPGRYRGELTLDLSGNNLVMPTIPYINLLVLPCLGQ